MKWDYPVPESWINNRGLGYLQKNSAGVYHPGFDFNHPAGGDNDLGSPVYACADGVVDYAKDDGCGFGKHIFIRHDYPKGHPLYSHYAHLQAIQVSKNSRVRCGQQIGLCGYSGRCSGVWWSTAHLHFEIRRPIGQGYNYWPVGKSKEWIREHYYDPVEFILKNRKEVTVSDFLKENIPGDIEDKFNLQDFDWYDDHWTGEELLNFLLAGGLFIESDVSSSIEDEFSLKEYDWYDKKWLGGEFLEYLIDEKLQGDEYKTLFEEQREDNEHLREELSDSATILREREDEIAKLESRLTTKKEQVTELSEETKDLRAELDSLQEETADQYAKYESDIESLEKKVTTLEKNLKRCREASDSDSAMLLEAIRGLFRKVFNFFWKGGE